MSAAQGAKAILRISNQPSIVSSCQISKAGLSTSSSSNAEEGRKSKMSVNVKEGVNLANMKRGSGYRSSFTGTVATVFGATGMIGRGVTSRFGKNGTQMIIPYKGDFYDAQRLKVCGDLGQVLFTPYHLKDEESIRKSMKYSDIVINCIGREYETRNFKFKDVNVTGPATLARIAKEMGVKRFIHISSINASDNPQWIFMPGGSNFLKTKREGERAVLAEFPDATIFRPTEMYGHGDHLVGYYNSWLRKASFATTVALWKKGVDTVRSPLFNQDLTSGIMAALADPGTKGQIFEAMGPQSFVQGHLVDWMHEVMHKDPVDYEYRLADLRWNPATFAKAATASFLPWGLGNKYFRAPTLERLERSQLSEVSEGLPNIADLGVKLGTVEEKMTWELIFYRAFQGHDYQTEEEKPKIHPLVPLTPMEVKQISIRSKEMLELR